MLATVYQGTNLFALQAEFRIVCFYLSKIKNESKGVNYLIIAYPQLSYNT